MAVINQYKMYGVTSTAAEGPIKFFGTTTISWSGNSKSLYFQRPYIMKSLHVTNKSGVQYAHDYDYEQWFPGD